MAVNTKLLARTAAATSSATLYTQPSTSTITVVTNIAVTNTGATAGTFTLSIGGVAIQSGSTLAANSTAYLDLKQVIPASDPVKTITGFASTTSINFHISGVEIV
jgi:hypothetical protein